jgi:hypothetical protein
MINLKPNLRTRGSGLTNGATTAPRPDPANPWHDEFAVSETKTREPLLFSALEIDVAAGIPAGSPVSRVLAGFLQFGSLSLPPHCEE